MTEPTPEAQSGLLWTYLKGYHAVHHIAMGTEMGLFGKLQEAGEAGCSSADLASSAELHAPYVDVWCRTGHHYGLLEGGDDGRYRLAPFMDKLLVDAADPRHLAPYVMTTARFVHCGLQGGRDIGSRNITGQVPGHHGQPPVRVIRFKRREFHGIESCRLDPLSLQFYVRSAVFFALFITLSTDPAN